MPLRLHLGCGARYKDGYLNVDRYAPGRKDLAADIAALPFRDGTVDEIVSFHVIEHLPRPAYPRALAHWTALLKPGGRLVVECPNLEEVCSRFLAADEAFRQRWWIQVLYGQQDHPGEFHLNGFTPSALYRALEAAGMTRIVLGPGDPLYVHSCGMRAEAVKPD